MAWNQPKPEDDKPEGERPDPWGSKRRPEPPPPDMDDLLQKLLRLLKRLLTGSGDFRLLGMVLPVLAGIVLVSGFYQVEQGGQALVFRLGQLQGLTGPGLHWRLPLVDNVHIVDADSARELPLSARIITADANVVDVSVQVRYQVHDVKAYAQSLADPESALSHATEARLRQILGSLTLDHLIGPERAGLDSLLAPVQADMDRYHTGLHVEAVRLTDIRVPRETQAAWSDIATAGQEAEASKVRAAAAARRSEDDARVAAAQVVADATAYQHEAVDRAQAEAERFSPVLAAYRKSPQLVRSRLYFDTMQAVLDKVTTVVVADKGINPSVYLPAEPPVSTAASGTAATGPAVSGPVRQEKQP